MANHGRCRKCWWRDETGYCFMWRHNTNDDSYCPDYKNRSKSKVSLSDWVEKVNVKKE